MAEFLSLGNSRWSAGQALAALDVAALIAAIAPRPAAPAMLGQVPVKGFPEARLGIGEAIDRFMADTDLVAFKPHASRDLLGRATGLERVFDRSLQFRMNDELLVHRATAPCMFGAFIAK